MRFEKWQALGNDYLILERDELPFPLSAGRVRALCRAHSGVHSDGVLLLSPAEEDGCAARLQIFNPDGSESALSGNGAREAALYLRRRGWADRDRFAIQTAAGRIEPHITSPTTCRMALGRARLQSPDYPAGPPDGRGELESAGRRWRFQHVQVGNPQCAIQIQDRDELEALELPRYGPEIEHHALFPHRTNVSWYVTLGAQRIRARIFERGVGETTASGTGATGAAVAHVVGGGHSPVTVVLDGGELEVEVGEELEVVLSGWARPVFTGRLADEFVEELHETE